MKSKLELDIEKIDEIGTKCCELYKASKDKKKPVHRFFRGHFCPECNLKLKTVTFCNWNLFGCNECGYKYCSRDKI